jgi:hypothetical protein
MLRAPRLQIYVPANCTNCPISQMVYSHNSTANQTVTSINFGSSPRVDNPISARQTGFSLGYDVHFGGACPGNPATDASATYFCGDAPGYCATSPPYATFTRTTTSSYQRFGDLVYVIPTNVSGIRLKVQRTYVRSTHPGNSTVQLNGVTLWTAARCGSNCPSIVTATVQAGDTLLLREDTDNFAIFWLELWEWTQWPTATLELSGDVLVPGMVCGTCPVNYTGSTCLPIDPTAASVRSPPRHAVALTVAGVRRRPP